MTIKGILTLFHLLLLVSAAIHAKPPANTEELQAIAAFARLKSLAGDWQSVGPNGEHSRLNYQVISGGTAVMERFSSDALPHNGGSMITVYYIDKGQLVLTHYCIAGNQPHLRATLYDPQSGELDFDFVSGGNIVSGEEGHMHSARIRFVDDDHVSSEWQFMQARAPKFTELSQFTRVK
ncbi:MAG TPA: hypothetical protein VJQ54_22245 [Candidatus Sulfotelmatobacter sp.]|nr:hypothetical protein [Candidatus Sulfotelmatobacter sp.]